MTDQEVNDNNNSSNENKSNDQNENKVENDDQNILQEVSDRPTERPTEANNVRYTEVDNGFSLEGFGNLKDNNVISEQNNEEGKKEENKENLNQKEKEVQNDLYKKQTYNLKIIVLGDVAVGKTSVIRRYIKNTFTDDHISTISCENENKIIEIDGETAANLQIWDTAGEEKFMSVTKQYYNGSNGVIIIYDLTNKDSFIKLNKWIKDVKEKAPKDIVINIAGNKSDLIGQKVELGKELENLKKIYEFHEISAKTGSNISLAFETLAYKIIEDIKNKKEKGIEINERESVALKKHSINKKKKKCLCNKI